MTDKREESIELMAKMVHPKVIEEYNRTLYGNKCEPCHSFYELVYHMATDPYFHARCLGSATGNNGAEFSIDKNQQRNMWCLVKGIKYYLSITGATIKLSLSKNLGSKPDDWSSAYVMSEEFHGLALSLYVSSTGELTPWSCTVNKHHKFLRVNVEELMATSGTSWEPLFEDSFWIQYLLYEEHSAEPF